MNKTILTALLLFLAMLSAASAATVTVGDVDLGENDPVQRSNPFVQRDNDKLDDTEDLEYASFSIPVTASNGTVTVNSISVDTGKFNYEPFDDEVNSSAELEIVTSLPLTVTNETQNVVVRVLVASDLDAIDASFNAVRHTTTATLDTSEGTQTSELAFYAENLLELDELEIEIDGRTFECDSDPADEGDCDDEVEEVQPGDPVRLNIILENKFDGDTDTMIEDVDLRLDSDNSDIDFDEDSEDIGDIDADDTESFQTDLDIDNDVEEGDDADITLEVEGDDENGARHGFDYEFKIEFELPEGEVDLKSFTASSRTICQGDSVTFDFEFENEGSDDQDNVRFTIVSDNLGLNKIFTGIDLEDAERSSNDNDFSDSYTFQTRDSQRAGTYTVRGTVFYEDEDGDDASEFLDTSITIEDCNAPTTTTPTVPTVPTNGNSNNNNGQDSGIVVSPPTSGTGTTTTTTAPSTPTTSGPARAVVIDSTSDNNLMIIGLALVFVILLIVVVWLFVVLLRK